MMITNLAIEGFKSLRKVRVEPGQVNLLIGTNSSGKSNFLEALRFLHGIANDLRIGEALSGKPGAGPEYDWQGIRGGTQQLAFVPLEQKGPLSRSQRVSLHSELKDNDGATLRHEFEFSAKTGKVRCESLSSDKIPAFRTRHQGNPKKLRTQLFYGKQWVSAGKPSYKWYPPDDRSLLAIAASSFQSPSEIQAAAQSCRRILGGMQFLSPDTEHLRDYCKFPLAQRLGEHGENFAGVVNVICSSQRDREAYVSWLRELLPLELSDVEIRDGAQGDVLFALKNGKAVTNAEVLSDGTLRFAAIAAVFFQPEKPSVLALEEIEDGIHPTRLRTLLNLLSSQAQRTGIQVFATTHAPHAVDWARAFGGVKVFHFHRHEKTGETVIAPLDLESFNGTSVGELMGEGWLEATA